jgi:uncharacterized protein
LSLPFLDSPLEACSLEFVLSTFCSLEITLKSKPFLPEVIMDLRSLLEEIARIKGLTSIAIVGEDGFVIESATSDGGDIDLDFLGGVASSSLAAGQSLAEFFGKGEVAQVMIEFAEGPVLLTPLGNVSVLATLDSSQNLGRVRFQLKKYLPRLQEAAA